MRRTFDYMLMGLFLIMLSGCGIKDNPVTVSADVNIIDGTQLENINEKVKETVEDVEAQLEEHIEEEEIEEASSTPIIDTMPSKKERQKMIAEKIPAEENDIIDEIPLEITEEYNKRLKEKENGIYYVPEEIYSKYMNISDAEIIEIVNKRFFELHNELRAELGLPLFERDERLDEVADIRAEEISYCWSPTHVRPNGESVLEILSTLGMPSYGENIVMGANYEPNVIFKEDYELFADGGFDWLCNSTEHYANITEKHYIKIGIDSYVIHYDDGCIAVYTAFEFGS
ncbi:MAG: hypothetical protein K2N85_15765 [Lachnospiraceae bacterium]|nr:hypothetical protein [Lachnospiraceae bacterium]